jgi:hypothetical protein
MVRNGQIMKSSLPERPYRIQLSKAGQALERNCRHMDYRVDESLMLGSHEAIKCNMATQVGT